MYKCKVKNIPNVMISRMCEIPQVEVKWGIKCECMCIVTSSEERLLREFPLAEEQDMITMNPVSWQVR